MKCEMVQSAQRNAVILVRINEFIKSRKSDKKLEKNT